MKIEDFEFKIARLELGPDDILVFRSKQPLPATAIVRLRDTLRSAVGDRKCLVLDSGDELAVLAPAPVDHVRAGKTDDELQAMIERGEISLNDVRRAKALRPVADADQAAAS